MVAGKTKQEIIRLKYSVTCEGYDELYREEQQAKYHCAIVEKGYKPKSLVLDLGGGTGLLLEFLAGNSLLAGTSYYICLDLTPCMLEQCQHRARRIGLDHLVELVEADAEHIPLREGSVNTVYSFTVLDLLHEPQRGVREVARICKDIAVISSLKRASKSYIKGASVLYGVKLCETDKDVIFVKRCNGGSDG